MEEERLGSNTTGRPSGEMVAWLFLTMLHGLHNSVDALSARAEMALFQRPGRFDSEDLREWTDHAVSQIGILRQFARQVEHGQQPLTSLVEVFRTTQQYCASVAIQAKFQRVGRANPFMASSSALMVALALRPFISQRYGVEIIHTFDDRGTQLLLAPWPIHRMGQRIERFDEIVDFWRAETTASGYSGKDLLELFASNNINCLVSDSGPGVLTLLFPAIDSKRTS